MFGRNEVSSAFVSDGKTLIVNDIFATLQGEGPDAGVPSIFVRLAKCNLRCWFSFGWRSNYGKQPRVFPANGRAKRLGEVKTGDVLLTLNERGELVKTRVTRVLRHDVDVWYRVVIEGTNYLVTPEHPFFTNRGLVNAEDLQVDDEIIHVEGRDVITYKKLGERNPIHNPEVMARKLQNTDYQAMGRTLSKTIKQRIERGESWGFGNWSSENKEALAKQLSQARRREANPNFNPDRANRNFTDLKYEVAEGLHECTQCRKRPGPGEWSLEVHHIDHDPTNDAKSNLTTLCKSCHTIVHEKWNNFPWAKQVAQNGMRVEYIQRVDRSSFPPSARPQALPIVSLTCAPYPTYLADNMLHHNCDTEFEQGALYSVPNLTKIIADLARRNDYHLVVITGGEPLLQNIVPLVAQLNYEGLMVSVETAGTVYVPKLDDWFDSERAYCRNLIVCSPKTPKLNEQLIPLIGAFKYIIEYGKVAEDDGLPISSTQIRGERSRLYRPTDRPKSSIYVQPCDVQDAILNKRNLQQAVDVALKFGYRLSVQMHKLAELP